MNEQPNVHDAEGSHERRRELSSSGIPFEKRKSVTAEPGTDEYKNGNDEPYVAPSRNVILHLAPRYSHGPR